MKNSEKIKQMTVTKKITNSEITALMEMIDHPSEGFLSQNISVVTKYKISKFAEQIRKNFQIFEQLRISLVKKYGKDTPEGFRIVPEDPRWEDFINELDQLLSIEEEYILPRLEMDVFDFKSKLDFSKLIDLTVYG